MQVMGLSVRDRSLEDRQGVEIVGREANLTG